MGPVSSLIPLSADTVAIGLVSSLVVYPVYLVILFLFWMSRSRVGWGQGLQGAGRRGQVGRGPRCLCPGLWSVWQPEGRQP